MSTIANFNNMARATDNFEVGQRVVAAFTNCGRANQFVGVIVGKTKNYWKVQSETSPYAGEAAGRVFHIATLASRTYSRNNRIVEVKES